MANSLATERPQLSLRQLQYFIALADQGSFSEAARLVGVSQPSLFAQIGHLEATLGVPLVSRKARGVEVTPAGAILMRHAVAALSEIKRGVTAVAMGKGAPDVSLGVTPTAGRALVDDLIRGFDTVPKRLKLRFQEGIDDLWQRVLQGELDAALSYDPVRNKELRCFPLYRENLVVVGRPDALARLPDPLGWKQLAELPLVLGYRSSRTRQVIEGYAHSARVTLGDVEELEPRTLKYEVLMRRGRCSIVPYGLFRDEINLGRLSVKNIQPPITRTLVLVMRKSLPKTVVQPLLKAVRKAVQRRIDEKLLNWHAI